MVGARGVKVSPVAAYRENDLGRRIGENILRIGGGSSSKIQTLVPENTLEFADYRLGVILFPVHNNQRALHFLFLPVKRSTIFSFIFVKNMPTGC